MEYSRLYQLINDIFYDAGFEIPQEILDEILTETIIKQYKKNEIIIHCGDSTTNIGLVLDGMVRSYYIDSEGNDITRWFGETGQLCIDEGLYGYKESPCTWHTLSDCTIVFVNTSKFKSIIMSHENLKTIYIDMLERALRYKVYRENGFLVENATERYLHFRKKYPGLCHQVKLSYIASYLGITPETLSRIRSKL